MMKQPRLSVIVPTYTGEEHILGCLKSILEQNTRTYYEVIVVIDGPNKMLRERVEVAKKDFEDRHVSFTIDQLSENKGRFTARKTGAELAAALPELICRTDLQN